MREQTFFKDPAIDRLMGMVMALAAEVYILRDRNQALEEILEKSGVLQPGAIENLEPDPQQRQQMNAERDAFIARIMEPLTTGGFAPANVNEELVAQLTEA